MPTLCAPAAEPEPNPEPEAGCHRPYPTARQARQGFIHHDFTHWPLPVGRVENRHGLTFVHSLAPGGFRAVDYLKIPDTNRVELWDGILVVYPERDRRRQALARYFYELLEHMCEGELAPFIGPMDVPVSRSTVFAPDLVVFPRSGPPALVVEFRRDDTVKATQERWAKLGGYAKAGVRIYWAVDPETLTLRVYERGGRGRRAAWSQPEGMPSMVSPPEAEADPSGVGLPGDGASITEGTKSRLPVQLPGPVPGQVFSGQPFEIQDDPKVPGRVIEGLRRL